MKKAIIATLLSAFVSAEGNDTSSLEYVFQIVRHGARAPMIEDPRFAIEPTQMLTPQGMR